LLYGQPEVRQLAAAFEKDLTQSKLIDAQQFRDRSVWVKAAEGGARLLSPIL
jgi:hypothetical protein